MENTKQNIPLQLYHHNQNIFHYFPTLNEGLEVFFVLKGLKSCARQEIHENNLARAMSFFDAYGVHYRLSDFKVLEDGAMVERRSPVEGKFFVYFSLDDGKAEHAKFYESIKNDEKLGEILGYPKCCRKFYKDKYDEAYEVGDEYSLLTMANSSGFPFQTNYLLRFFGISLMSHFPCSFTCPSSYDEGMAKFEAIRQENPQLAGYIRDALRGPVISHVGTGIHALKDYDVFPNGEIGYRDPWMTNQNEMDDVLKLCNNIKILNKNHVQFRQDYNIVDEVKGKHIGAVVFE